MDIDLAREKLPLFIQGSLSKEDMMAVSRMLANDPELTGDLRLAVSLHDELLRGAPEPPPFPRAVYQETRNKALVPRSVLDSMGKLRFAAGITGKVIRLVLKFI